MKPRYLRPLAGVVVAGAFVLSCMGNLFDDCCGANKFKWVTIEPETLTITEGRQATLTAHANCVPCLELYWDAGPKVRIDQSEYDGGLTATLTACHAGAELVTVRHLMKDVSAQCSVTVTSALPVAIKLFTDYATTPLSADTLLEGEAMTIQAGVYDPEGVYIRRDLNWSSSDTGVVEVSLISQPSCISNWGAEAFVRGRRAGHATIMATYQKLRATAEFTVVPAGFARDVKRR